MGGNLLCDGETILLDVLHQADNAFKIAMGHTPLVISSRLSADVAEALIEKAGGDVFVHGSLKTTQPNTVFRSIQFVSAEQLDAPEVPTAQTRCDPAIIDSEDCAWIAHSSGTTGLPKLFKELHGLGMGKLRDSLSWSHLNDKEWVSSAVYNIVGLKMLMMCPLRKGPLVYDNDRILFTSEGLVDILEEVRPKCAYVTTYSLEMIAADPRGIENLTKCNKVAHFGAVLPKALGDGFVQRGVKLSTRYGQSESRLLLTSTSRPQSDVDWDYMWPHDDVREHILFRPVGIGGSGSPFDKQDQLYEFICLASCPGILEAAKTLDYPPGSYHTGDLFLKHPSKENRWKIVGRMDDQLKIYHEDRQAVINVFVYEEKIKRGNEDVIDEVVSVRWSNERHLLTFSRSSSAKAKQSWVFSFLLRTRRVMRSRPSSSEFGHRSRTRSIRR